MGPVVAQNLVYNCASGASDGSIRRHCLLHIIILLHSAPCRTVSSREACTWINYCYDMSLENVLAIEAFPFRRSNFGGISKGTLRTATIPRVVLTRGTPRPSHLLQVLTHDLSSVLFANRFLEAHFGSSIVIHVHTVVNSAISRDRNCKRVGRIGVGGSSVA